MPFHPDTLRSLRQQATKLHNILTNPDPDISPLERDRIQSRVDRILDERPRVHSIANDGEIIWSSASTWVKDQGSPLPPGETIAVNATGQAEVVTRDPRGHLWDGLLPNIQNGDEPPEPNGGGIGLLDRP